MTITFVPGASGLGSFWAPIAERLPSADVLTIEEGSLYPAVQRMLVKRWVLAEWKIRRTTG